MGNLSAPRLQDKNVLTGVSFQMAIDTLPNVYFTKMSELKQTKEPGEYYDGISNRKRHTGDGTLSCEPVTFEIPYDPKTAKLIGEWVADYFDGDVSDLSVRPIRVKANGDVFPLSVAYFLGNCRLSEFSPISEVDRGSNDVVMTKLTFTIEYFSQR